jgi:hypothetical protein
VLANRTSGTDATIHAIRSAHMAFLADNASVLHLGTNHDMVNSDGIHHDEASERKLAARMALAVTGGSARGPFLSAAAVDETTLTLSVANATAPVSATGDPNVIEVFDDGLPVTPTGWSVNADTLTVTLPSTPSGAVTVRHAYGSADGAVDVYDSAAYDAYAGLPLGPTNDDITASVTYTRAVSAVDIADDTLTLTTAGAMPSGATVTLDYVEGANPLKAADGEAVGGFEQSLTEAA